MKKTKVLIIYPQIPQTIYNYSYIMKYINKKSLFPPLGPPTVAALLPDTYEPAIIDMGVAQLTRKDIREADLIFISSMVVQHESFELVVKLCENENATIVAGGPYVTAIYSLYGEKDSSLDDNTRWERFIDRTKNLPECQGLDRVHHFVMNEGEITIPQFLRDYEKGTAKRIYWDETKPDMVSTPLPRFDLLDLGAYSTAALQFSRGCPYSCDFCEINVLYGRKHRSKSPEQCVLEMEQLHKLHFDGRLFLVDDNFIGNKKWAKDVLKKIIVWQAAHGYPFQLSTELSVNIADDDELLDLMAEAGFHSVFLGIESPDKNTLQNANKNHNTMTDLALCVEKIQRKGINVDGGFILGFDSDPENIFDLQIDFIKKTKIPSAFIALLGIIPNTALYHRLKKENRYIENSSRLVYMKLKLNYIPIMPEKTIIDGYCRVLLDIYNPENYFERCLGCIERMPHSFLIKSVAFPEKIPPIKALRMLMSFIVSNIFNEYGKHFLKFLGKVKNLDDKYLPLAVTMGIRGFHYYMMTKQIVAQHNKQWKLAGESPSVNKV